MLIAQISDTHISEPGTKAYGIAPMAENLALCVEHINQQEPLPDVVLVTGDISYSGKEEELAYAADLLDKLTMPYYVIPGNHDNRSALLSVFQGDRCPVEVSTDNQFIHYVVDGFPLSLIAVDSVMEGEPGGEICEKRLAWLEKQLIINAEKPCVLFMHHPPAKFNVIESDIDGFIGAAKLGELVCKYPNVQRILCGHLHLATFQQWNGTVISVAPSTGMGLLLDLTMKLPSQFFLDPPSYQLHLWNSEQSLISHTVIVKNGERSYLFEKQ